MKKTIKVLIILIVLIIASIGALAALYFYTDIFKTPEQLFWKYFSNNSQIISLLENENKDLQNNLKQVNSYTTNGNLKVSLQQNEEQPQEIQIDTTSRHDASTGRTYADAKLKAGENSISASYINSDNIYAVKCDNIYQHYIGFRNSELKELARKFELDEEEISQIPDSINFENIMSEFKLSEEEKQNYKENYSNAIFQYISEENYSKLGKANIEVNGINYEVNKYQLMVEGETLKNILISVLENVKNDEKIINYMNKMDSPELFPIDNKKIIEDDIAEIKEQEMKESFTISVYEKNGETLKTEIELSNALKISIDIVNDQAILDIEALENEKTTEDSNYNTYNSGLLGDIQGTNNTQGLMNINSKTENAKIQIVLSKLKNENEIINQIKLIANENGMTEEIAINISLGNVQDNIAKNNYEIIIDNNKNENKTNMNINYTNEITTTTQIEEIMELKNSNTVIINDYSLEQLEKFFGGIIKKVYGFYSTDDVFTRAKKATEDIEKSIIKEHMLVMQTEIGTDAMYATLDKLEKKEINNEYVKKYINDYINKREKYTILNTDNLGYDNLNYKIKGNLILADKDGQKYKMDFDNNTVEVQN